MVEILRDQTALGGAALATLATGVAVAVINASGTGLLADFLMKRVVADICPITFDSMDIITVGMARGDATVTEIKAAIELTQLERDMQDQANVRVVLWETVRTVFDNGDINPQPQRVEVSLGGGQGIPFERGDGWQWFCYNGGANDQVAGAFLFIDATYYGVWL